MATTTETHSAEAMKQHVDQNVIQVVFVKWGSMFTAAHVNGLCDTIRRKTQVDIRFVCVCDDATGLYPDIVHQRFPDFSVPFKVLIQTGYLAKVAIFDRGILEPGLKTVFLDLDTAVLGDISKLADILDYKRALYMLPQHYVQHWRIRALTRLIRPKKCYFASSAIMAFYPEDYHYLAETLRDNLLKKYEKAISYGRRRSKRYRVDDHFISWYARDSLRVFPDRLTAKFQDAYTTFAFWTSALRDRLPWVVKRRQNRVALTFGGLDTKPERLLNIKNGDEIRYGRLVTRWNYTDLQQYWVDLEASQQKAKAKSQ